ncbi:SDR family NAD(P)-dependent oxidoreductase [Inquilinus sp. Marseille-Q2685]|uniref:SDR family NAD(P)-dependent oxidoreductase n=1 Tax=Inquilinus sp. Marseille-Q2685 TaxID=2866581 RepID=UPI001CE44D72|nr:SDR family NAD(P)-dependent oxidoreductase [Inquilinus sp. Marseille-Q2685]
MSVSPTALIIGASRGLGLALAGEWLARGWTVLATVRGAGRTALHELADSSNGRLTVETLEMTDPAAVDALRDRLSRRALDLLFVNAAVANGASERVDRVTTEEFSRVMVTNALAPMRIVERLGGLVRPDGTIAVMSSSLGSVALNETGGWEVYRASKAALNMLMRSYAARHAGDRHSLALVDPGWVRTDMGGAEASLDTGESIPGVADALEARRGRPGLQFFDYRGETVPW